MTDLERAVPQTPHHCRQEIARLQLRRQRLEARRDDLTSLLQGESDDLLDATLAEIERLDRRLDGLVRLRALLRTEALEMRVMEAS